MEDADKEIDRWWKKIPRSSRVCYRCGHKYSSHIDVRCLKLVQRKPIRIECVCKGFIVNKAEMDLINDRVLRRKKEKLEDAET